MRVTFGGASVNNANDTHLLVIMHVEMILHDLTNRNRFEKGKRLGTMYAKDSCLLRNLYKNVRASYYFAHTNVALIVEVWGGLPRILFELSKTVYVNTSKIESLLTFRFCQP